jgi:transaldolase
LKEWKANNQQTANSSQLSADSGMLTPIPYEQVDLNKNWTEYNLKHELTNKGIEKFAQDWNSLIK